MALTVFDDRSLTVSIRHVEAKPNGSFQYRRRVPVLFRGHYPGKAFFVRSLGRDPHALPRKAADLTAELDGLWRRLTATATIEEAKADPGSEGAGVAQRALQVLANYLTRARMPQVSESIDKLQVLDAPPDAPRNIIWD